MNKVCLEVVKRWKPLSSGKAIHKNCLECAGDEAKEVTLCSVTDCPLWGLRMGSILHNKDAQDRFETTQKRYPEEFAASFGGTVTQEEIKASRMARRRPVFARPDAVGGHTAKKSGGCV